MPHQFPGAGDLRAVDADLAPPGQRNGDVHLVRAVAPLGLHAYAAEVRAPAHQFAVLPRAVRAPRAAEVNGFQKVGLALRVVPGQHRHARAGPKLRARVVAVIGKFEGQYAHGAPFKERPRDRGRSVHSRSALLFAAFQLLAHLGVEHALAHADGLGVISTSSSSSMNSSASSMVGMCTLVIFSASSAAAGVAAVGHVLFPADVDVDVSRAGNCGRRSCRNRPSRPAR